MTIDEQLDYLLKGTTEIIREEELRAKLEKSAKTGKPLRIKLGADPTACWLLQKARPEGLLNKLACLLTANAAIRKSTNTIS